MPAPSLITVPQLARLIGLPDAPIVVDVCIDADFALDPRLVPGAFRYPFDRIEEISPRLDRRTVVVCQKGLKLSQGAAALLRTRGVAAEALEGGAVAWAAADLPMVPLSAVPLRDDGTTLWVTRHRPKIDRVACPWLIRRFVDRRARFLFVEPAQVELVAERYGATPFDVAGVRFSHREGCTFDTMLDAFGLRDEALDRMEQVVRAADTNRHADAPQAAGLLAFAVGLSRMYRDDLEQVEAGLPLFDALYRWARDGHAEGHDHDR